MRLLLFTFILFSAISKIWGQQEFENTDRGENINLLFTDHDFTVKLSSGSSANTLNTDAIEVVAIGTYRTASAGDWATLTWERYLSVTGWTADIAPANGTSDSILIYHNTHFNTSGTWNLFKVVIESGGTFNQSNIAGVTFTNLIVRTGGIFNLNELTVINSIGGVFEIDNNASFNANYSLSPLAFNLFAGTEIFHPASNFVVKDVSGANFITSESALSSYDNAGYSAYFGNLVIDYSGAGTFTLLALSSLFSGNLTHGNLVFRNVNGNMRMITGAAFGSMISPISIGGNVELENTFGFAVSVRDDAFDTYLTIKGDLINNSTSAFSFYAVAAGTMTITLNVEGNILINSGRLFFNAGSAITPVLSINLKGDGYISSGSIFSNLTASSAIVNFTGTGDGLTPATTQTIDISSTAATRNQYIDFYVKTGAYVQLINQDLQLGKNSTFTVEGSGSTGGTLDFNFAGSIALNITTYSSGCKFISEQASTLKISSPDGISNTSGAIGNVRLTNAPLYNQTARFWFIGKANQLTGTGITVGSSAKLVYVNMLDNTKTLTLSNNIGISNTPELDLAGGKLEIQKGIVIGTNSGDFNGTGRLVMSGGEYRIATITAAPLSNYLPQLSNYAAYSLTGGAVHLNGANAVQILSGTPSFYKLIFSGSNTLTLNYKGISTATTVTNNISIAETAIVDVKNASLGAPGTSFTMTDNSRYITDGSGTKPDAGGAYSLAATSSIEFANSSGAGIIRLGISPINYANIIVSGTNVANASLLTGIKFQSGGTLIVKTGATFKLANTAGFSGAINTAINNTNTPAISLQDGSTIDYNGSIQNLSNEVNIGQGSTGNYYHLKISGIGNKTATATSIEIKGNLIGGGTANFIHNNGTVLMNGAAVQTYSSVLPFKFYNLINGNTTPGGLILLNNLSIENLLTLSTNSKLDVGNSTSVTLISSAAKTASIAEIPAGADIIYNSGGGSGKFIVERFIPANRKWRLLTSPIQVVSSQTISDAWREAAVPKWPMGSEPVISVYNPKPGYGTHISGGSSTNGYDQNNTGNASLKYFDPAIMPDGEWKGLSTGISLYSKKVTDEKGYMLFVRGSRSLDISNGAAVVPDVTTLRSSGRLNVANNTPISYTLTGKQLIGNPFASAIDFKKIIKTGTLGDKYYLWDPKLGGQNGVGAFVTFLRNGSFYDQTITYTNGTYTGNPTPLPNDGTIESGAAFLVDFGTGGTLQIAEDAKINTSAATPFGRPAAPIIDHQKSLRTNLISVNTDSSYFILDGVLSTFNDAYNSDVDMNDALKINNFSENISLFNQNKLIAIERRKYLTENDTIFFRTTGLRVKKYQLELSANEIISDHLAGYLEDNQLATVQPINMQGISLFNFDVQNISTAAAANRFRIVFKKFIHFTKIKTSILNSDIAVDWSVAGALNINRYEIERSLDGFNFIYINAVSESGIQQEINNYNYLDKEVLPAGVYYYRIKCVSNNAAIAYSDIVMIMKSKEKNGIYIYPNPATNGKIGLQIKSMPPGNYQLRLINSIGQSVNRLYFAHGGGRALINIAYPPQLKGQYHVEIVTPENKKILLNLLIE